MHTEKVPYQQAIVMMLDEWWNPFSHDHHELWQAVQVILDDTLIIQSSMDKHEMHC